MSLKVDCPTCGTSIEWSPLNPFRPFCSDRCRLIDLGEWFSEDRAIPGDEPTPTENPALLQLSAEDLALLEQD